MTAEEAIKRIQDHMDVHRIGEYPHIKLREALNMAISALREQEERRWIPVAERLPERNGEYICRYGLGGEDSIKFTGVLCYFATDKNPHWQHESIGLICSMWMPLPDPPKEANDEKMQ